MSQLSEFITVNWALIAAFVIILALLVRNIAGGAGIVGLRPAEVVKLINHNDAIVVDVRTDQEFQSGHVLNAIHIPLGMFESRIQELDQYKELPIIMGCQSGNRSGKAVTLLVKRGFTHVYNLTGGMMAWSNASLPVTRKASKAIVLKSDKANLSEESLS